MSASTTAHLLDHARRSQLLAKLREYGADLAQMYLIVLVRRGDQVVEVDLTGSQAQLPEFCRVVRQCEEGLRRCTTCRSLVAFSACYRGMTEYTCHGSVSVLAAPVRRDDPDPAECVVVSSCAFTLGSQANGWRRAKSQAAGLPVEPKTLRRAYRALPRFDENQLPLAHAFVDLAATALSEVEQLQSVTKQALGTHAGRRPARRVPPKEQDLGALLRLSQAAADDCGNGAGAASMTDLVKAMVERDPSMPFTVSKIAAAARISPNHFSTLFHQQTAETFVDYLTGKRLELAKRLLRDPAYSVKEVARRSGFSDPAYFARRFKISTGQTPTQYRRRL